MPPAHPLLAEFLATTDAPCPRCHFNLRGLSSGVCPECGASITLGVTDGRRVGGPHTRGAIALAAGLGAAAVIVVASLIQTAMVWHRRLGLRLRLDFDDSHASTALAAVGIFGVLYAAWHLYAPSIRRWPRPAQEAAVAVMLLLVAGFAALLGFMG